MIKTITKENATTKSEIAYFLFARKEDGFHEFVDLVEEMLDRYASSKSNDRQDEVIEENHFT